MNDNFEKQSGICLILGTLQVTTTMVLHPSGGSNEHILKISGVLIATHAIALLSLPLLAYGFYALSAALSTPGRLSLLGFIIMIFGLAAVMMAAIINGITLPLFLSDTQSTDTALLENIRKYGLALSAPMAYIFIVASSLSISIWSALLLRRSKSSKLAGIYGIALIALPVAAFLLGYNMAGLWAFRVYVLGSIGWIAWTGVLMISGKLTKQAF